MGLTAANWIELWSGTVAARALQIVKRKKRIAATFLIPARDPSCIKEGQRGAEPFWKNDFAGFFITRSERNSRFGKREQTDFVELWISHYTARSLSQWKPNVDWLLDLSFGELVQPRTEPSKLLCWEDHGYNIRRSYCSAQFRKTATSTGMIFFASFLPLILQHLSRALELSLSFFLFPLIMEI